MDGATYYWQGIKVTSYFIDVTAVKHPEIFALPERIAEALTHPSCVQLQSNGWTRRWVWSPELDHHIRVIVLDDRETVHNAFVDRGFTP